MAVAAKPKSSFHIDKCDFNKLVLNKNIYLVIFNEVRNFRVTKLNYETELPNMASHSELQTRKFF